MTKVWPALWPPWKRTTISACSDNQSTILPFPSSPHWAPTTTTLAIRSYSLCNYLDAQPKTRPGPLAREAPHRIKDAGYRRKQERVSDPAWGTPNPLISPENSSLAAQVRQHWARTRAGSASPAFQHATLVPGGRRYAWMRPSINSM